MSGLLLQGSCTTHSPNVKTMEVICPPGNPGDDLFLCYTFPPFNLALNRKTFNAIS